MRQLHLNYIKLTFKTQSYFTTPFFKVSYIIKFNGLIKRISCNFFTVHILNSILFVLSAQLCKINTNCSTSYRQQSSLVSSSCSSFARYTHCFGVEYGNIHPQACVGGSLSIIEKRFQSDGRMRCVLSASTCRRMSL